MRACRRTGLFLAAALAVPALASPPDPSDPVLLPGALSDPRRPPAAELTTSVSDGFTLALVGDLIPSRPLLTARPVPGFDKVVALLRGADVTYGNMETSLIDIRHFNGHPYSYEGDWTNIAPPAVAADLAGLGFDMVGIANNHATDWGLEGMRETARHLDAAGIIHAGTGENRGQARAARYLDTAKGRIALISFATTFRPTSDAMPARGEAPGRPGLNALHLRHTVRVPEPAMRALTQADCVLSGTGCDGKLPHMLSLSGTNYALGPRAMHDYLPDAEDVAEIHRSIRQARQHADLVLVALHAHECDWACGDVVNPQLPAAFLKDLARGAVDAGADVFAVTGIHNLGPLEVYRDRPIFYGLGNFIWGDIQEPLPYELFQGNRDLLAATYRDPSKATDYDLTAPLNAGSFANEHTFQSVIAEVRFGVGKLVSITLHPVALGYGDRLEESGMPRLATDKVQAGAILDRIARATTDYGLAPLRLTRQGGAGIIKP
ncbi:CapA family protein [Niveispirillum sp. KHB5.9]|uniref:CapA family protein n=1 Tax=Niveispirillum sp. KHB5.9 TaxID=3400269 RepID=UPI003A84CB86